MDTAGETSNPRGNKRHTYLPLLVAGVMVITTCTGLWLVQTARSHRIPKELIAAKSAVPYTLYYPDKLPKHVSYVTSSLKLSKNVTIYTLAMGGKKVFVSTIPKPKGVVFSDFYTRILTNKADVFSAAGKAAIGIANDHMVGSLVTDSSWVIINAPPDTDNQTMQSTLSSLKAVK